MRLRSFTLLTTLVSCSAASAAAMSWPMPHHGGPHGRMGRMEGDHRPLVPIDTEEAERRQGGPKPGGGGIWPSSSSHWADVPSDLGRSNAWKSWGKHAQQVRDVPKSVFSDDDEGEAHAKRHVGGPKGNLQTVQQYEFEDEFGEGFDESDVPQAPSGFGGRAPPSKNPYETEEESYRNQYEDEEESEPSSFSSPSFPPQSGGGQRFSPPEHHHQQRYTAPPSFAEEYQGVEEGQHSQGGSRSPLGTPSGIRSAFPTNFEDFKQSVAVESSADPFSGDRSVPDTFSHHSSSFPQPQNSFKRETGGFGSGFAGGFGGNEASSNQDDIVEFDPQGQGLRVTREYSHKENFGGGNGNPEEEDIDPYAQRGRPERKNKIDPTTYNPYGTTINHIPDGDRQSHSYASFTPPGSAASYHGSRGGEEQPERQSPPREYEEEARPGSYQGQYSPSGPEDEGSYPSRPESSFFGGRSDPSAQGGQFEQIKKMGDDILDEQFNKFNDQFENHNRGSNTEEDYHVKDGGDDYKYERVNYREPIQSLYSREQEKKAKKPEEEDREYGTSYGAIEAYQGEYNSDNDKNYRPGRHNYEPDEDEETPRGRYEEIDPNEAQFRSSIGKDSLKKFKDAADVHDDDDGYYIPKQPEEGEEEEEEEEEGEGPGANRYRYGGGQAQRRSFEDFRKEFEGNRPSKPQDQMEQDATRIARTFSWGKTDFAA